MIHNSITAMKNYIFRGLRIFVLSYVTINRIYGDLSLWSTEHRNSMYLRRRSDDSSYSLIIIHIYIHIYRTCTHRACVASPVAIAKTSKFRAASQYEFRRRGERIVVSHLLWTILYTTRRATWQSVS